MSRDEVGVEMGLDDPANGEAALAGKVDVEVDVPLGVDDRGFAVVVDDVRGMGEAAQVETLDLHFCLRLNDRLTEREIVNGATEIWEEETHLSAMRHQTLLHRNPTHSYRINQSARGHSGCAEIP